MATFDTTWDIDKYKNEHEMEHEWNLKKKFMLAHKDKYDEDRLVCLAQLFCNVYFLGCKYAEPVMELLENLSKGVCEKNKKWESQTFVLASTAVEDKVKARFNKEPQPTAANRPVQFVQASNLVSESKVPDQNSLRQQEEGVKKPELWVRGQKRPAQQPGFCSNKDSEFGPLPPKISRFDRNDSDQNFQNEKSKIYGFEQRRIQNDINKVVESGPFGKVVVFQSAMAKEESPISVIERTANAAHMTTSFDFKMESDEITCKLSLDGLYLATGQGWNQKMAKESACKVAIERLKETSFTIIVKASYIASESVDRELTGNSLKPKEGSSVDVPIADSNIGSKMLKLMGWSGGGLGKNQQGMEEPIKPYDMNIRRRGLGITNFGDFKRKMIRIIEDFAHRDTKEDLVFSPDFSKDERKLIHELVRKYNLKSRSFGKEDANRRLVIFKKIRPLEIVEDLLSCGGETEKYQLIAPLSINGT